MIGTGMVIGSLPYFSVSLAARHSKAGRPKVSVCKGFSGLSVPVWMPMPGVSRGVTSSAGSKVVPLGALVP